METEIELVCNYTIRYKPNSYLLETYDYNKDINTIKNMNNIGNDISILDMITNINDIYVNIKYIDNILKTNIIGKDNKENKSNEYNYTITNNESNILCTGFIDVNDILIIEACKNIHNIIKHYIKKHSNEKNIIDTIDTHKILDMLDSKIDKIDNTDLKIITIWSDNIYLLVNTSYTLNKEKFYALHYDLISCDHQKYSECLISEFYKMYNSCCSIVIMDMISRTKIISKILYEIMYSNSYIYLPNYIIYEIIKYSLMIRCIIDQDVIEYILDNGHIAFIMLLLDYLILTRDNFVKICSVIIKYPFNKKELDQLCNKMIRFIQETKEDIQIKLCDLFGMYSIYQWYTSKYFERLINLIIEREIHISKKSCEILLRCKKIKLTSNNKAKLNILYITSDIGPLNYKQITECIEQKYIILNEQTILKLIQRGCSVDLIVYLINICKVDFTMKFIIEACIHGSSKVHEYLRKEYGDIIINKNIK